MFNPELEKELDAIYMQATGKKQTVRQHIYESSRKSMREDSNNWTHVGDWILRKDNLDVRMELCIFHSHATDVRSCFETEQDKIICNDCGEEVPDGVLMYRRLKRL